MWQDALPSSRHLPQKLLGICRVPLTSSMLSAEGQGESAPSSSPAASPRSRVSWHSHGCKAACAVPLWRS